MTGLTADLDAALDQLRVEGKFSLTFAGVVERQNQLRLYKPSGTSMGAVYGATIAMGHGLGGQVATCRRPRYLRDYVRSSGISHRYDYIIEREGLHSIAAAPVIVGNEVRTVMYAAMRRTVPLGDRTFDRVVAAARAYEHEIVVREQVEQQLDHAKSAIASRDEVLQNGPLAFADVCDKLRDLAMRISDPMVRDEVLTMTTEAIALFTEPRANQKMPVALTSREREILFEVAQGFSNLEIALRLHLSVETIKSYLKSASAKLGATSRYDAVAIARRLMLLP